MAKAKNYDHLIGQKFSKLTIIKILYSYKVNNKSGTYWQCECDCGNLMETVSSRLKCGKTRSCGCNNRSKYEEWTEEILKEHNIEFYSEYRFTDCRNHYPLPFDFYLPKYNICIECQGQQHYEPYDRFGGLEGFERRKQNDKIKREYCENHGIFLLEIIYKLRSKQKIEKEIMNILDSATITV